MAKNLPVMWKTHVRSLIQEDPLEKGMASHSSTLAWRMPQTEETDGLQSWGRKESDMTEQVTPKRARRENGMFEAEERCLSAIFQPGFPDKILGTEVPSSKNLEPKYKAKTHGSSGTNGLMHYTLYCGDAGSCYTAQGLLGLRSCNPINQRSSALILNSISVKQSRL